MRFRRGQTIDPPLRNHERAPPGSLEGRSIVAPTMGRDRHGDGLGREAWKQRNGGDTLLPSSMDGRRCVPTRINNLRRPSAREDSLPLTMTARGRSWRMPISRGPSGRPKSGTQLLHVREAGLALPRGPICFSHSAALHCSPPDSGVATPSPVVGPSATARPRCGIPAYPHRWDAISLSPPAMRLPGTSEVRRSA
jgi:hypothetical protein